MKTQNLEKPWTDVELDQRAIAILRENEWGDYTLPTWGLYPYQWNWDSMFVALGFSEFDLDRAWREVETLFQGQWNNGMAAADIINITDHNESSEETTKASAAMAALESSDKE